MVGIDPAVDDCDAHPVAGRSPEGPLRGKVVNGHRLVETKDHRLLRPRWARPASSHSRQERLDQPRQLAIPMSVKLRERSQLPGQLRRRGDRGFPVTVFGDGRLGNIGKSGKQLDVFERERCGIHLIGDLDQCSSFIATRSDDEIRRYSDEAPDSTVADVVGRGNERRSLVGVQRKSARDLAPATENRPVIRGRSHLRWRVPPALPMIARATNHMTPRLPHRLRR